MQQFINNWSAELTAPATASAVQLSVAPAAAALLTGLASGGYYLLTLVQVTDGTETAWEIIRVTARTSGVLDVLRGQEGTAAQEWPAGSLIEARLTQGSMEALRDAAAAGETAVQPGDLAAVATSGSFNDLTSKPAIPSTAAEVGAIPATEKGAALGVATLDASSKVPAAQLPSYVDDVIEAATFAALPGTGESGKIYVTLSDNKSWRWSGSAYVEISASPGSTDAVPEGASNKYFTESRVLATVLTGLSLATATAVTATDSVLQAIGKLVARLALKEQTLTAGPNVTIDRTDPDHPIISASITGGGGGDVVGPASSVGNEVALFDGITGKQLKGGGVLGTAAATAATDYATAAQGAKADAAIPATEKGAALGVATLDASSKVPAAQLPSYVDDVLEAANFAALPGTGESGKIYVTLDDNKSWRWSGSAYVEISASPGSTDAVPEGASNKYFTESRVLATVLTGLSLVTGGSISAADSVLSALGRLQKQITDALASIAGKQDTLVSGASLKTVNGSSLLGSGDLAISGGAQCIPIACSDETTALTAGTAKVTFRMPFAMTLSAVRASLTTAQTSGAILTVDVNEGGTSILSTKLTIDNTEKTSVTAATAAVISDAALADDAEITIDIDQVGDGTAKGLKVYLIGVPA